MLEIQFRIPFDKIEASHVEPAVSELLAEAKQSQKLLSTSNGPRTFAATLGQLETLTEKLDYAMGVIRHLESVATYPALREAYNKVQPEVSLFYSGIVLDAGIWTAIKEFAATDEARQLGGVRARLHKKTLESFRRNGADLDEAGKAKLQKIDVELAQATTKFSENVLDSTNAFELVITEQERLTGLPPSALEAARESAIQKGAEGWRFTLQAPSYNAVLTYLDDASTRQLMYRAYMTRATSGEFDNAPLLDRILLLRKQKAELLGFSSFADLVLEDRMAHTGDKALAFLAHLGEKTVERFQEENAELSAFRKSLEGAEAPELQPWDVAYYAEKQRARLYDFDEEALRPYFPAENVLSGLFDLAHRLYGIQVCEEERPGVWDAAVRYYSIRDNDKEGPVLGCFYADWFPRETKRGGAWMDSFLTGHRLDDGTFEPHLGLICGNLTPPVNQKPALLTHREVETVFHEFGHLLHHCLSRVEIRSMAGTNVVWDFVELPSQIMENWCWERESLDLFARHFETSETLPEDLFAKMKRARTFRAANAQMRQLGLANLDLLLHVAYTRDIDGDVLKYSLRQMQPFSPATLPDDHAMIAGFTHLFSSPVGYAAGYYSYKWAEVLEADAFTRFQKEGIFSESVGRDFRENILSRGDSTEPSELFRAFMGRDPDVSALLKRSGLVP
ncbi:MAG: M3 family metallopeptidase [Bryobacteraceae bacterium]|nr:M3 family metallopeptidase [Bryobacteraceae bacterium]